VLGDDQVASNQDCVAAKMDLNRDDMCWWNNLCSVNDMCGYDDNIVLDSELFNLQLTSGSPSLLPLK
jgi:hypothetical protein